MEQNSEDWVKYLISTEYLPYQEHTLKSRDLPGLETVQVFPMWAAHTIQL
jgi:hypothetical protein